MMRKTSLLLTVLLSGCVTTPASHQEWNIAGVKPQVSISAPKFLKDRVAFVVTVANDTDEKFCFDGIEDYPMGLLMYHAETGALFSWTSLIAGDEIGDLDSSDFTGPPIVRRELSPHSSTSVTVFVGAPLTGSFYEQGPDSKYEKGDPLVATGGNRFYDCSYSNEADASALGRSINVKSTQTATFREK